jgi:hypothetical protein
MAYSNDEAPSVQDGIPEKVVQASKKRLSFPKSFVSDTVNRTTSPFLENV